MKEKAKKVANEIQEFQDALFSDVKSSSPLTVKDGELINEVREILIKANAFIKVRLFISIKAYNKDIRKLIKKTIAFRFLFVLMFCVFVKIKNDVMKSIYLNTK